MELAAQEIAHARLGDAEHLSGVNAEVADARLARLDQEIAALEGELQRLAGAIAMGQAMEPLVTAMKDRDDRRRSLQRQHEVVHARTLPIDHKGIETRIRAILGDWRGLLRAQVPQARQILSKLLCGRLSVTPERRQGVRGFRLTGSGVFVKLFGESSELSLQPVASPTGTANGCNAKFHGIAA
jgi:hypothetical protein